MSKSTAEEIARTAATDFKAYYEQTEPPEDGLGAGHLVVLSCDGAAVAMLPEDLREATQRAAETDEDCPSGLFGGGERRNRKRRAMITAIYGIKQQPRTADDILPLVDDGIDEGPRPKPLFKRVAATLEDPAPAIAAMFDAADQLDPQRLCQRVALVDGDPHQVELIKAEAAKRSVEVDFVLDVVHLSEYCIEAGKALHPDSKRDARNWARPMLWLLLASYTELVLKRIAEERVATTKNAREKLDALATYITNHRHMIDYRRYLASGYPVGSGVVEGAVRHLLRHRLDRSGARWSLAGGEAVLQLRALYLNGDFDDYWKFHLEQEHQRNHAEHYADPDVVSPQGGDSPINRAHLRLVKS